MSRNLINDEKLYHATFPENLDSILLNGICPSFSKEREEKVVFLSKSLVEAFYIVYEKYSGKYIGIIEIDPFELEEPLKKKFERDTLTHHGVKSKELIPKESFDKLILMPLKKGTNLEEEKGYFRKKYGIDVVLK